MSGVFYFRHPFTCIIAGPTQSGKSVFITKLLQNYTKYIFPPPEKIIWSFGEFSEHSRDYSLPDNIELRTGLPEKDEFNVSLRTLVILDDMMEEAGKSVDVANFFTKICHHRNISVILILQNIFHQGKKMRDISLNANYIILFKNPRDRRQIMSLGTQIFPKHSTYVIDAYEQATKRPYGYLIIDLTQKTEENERLKTGIFPPEIPIKFIPKQTI